MLIDRASLVAWTLLAAALLSGAAGAQGETALVSVEAEARALQELGIALEHSERRGARTAFAATPWERAQLERAAIDYRVLIPDLAAYYAARLRAESELWAGASPGDALGFGFGSMGGYYTWAEMVAKLDEMRASYPALVTVKESLGLSHLGRPLWMVRISDNADRLDEIEPAALYTGLTHGNEPMGMEVVLYTMFHLLERYGVDPEVTYLVDNRELYFVPAVNPDGYVHNQNTNPSGGGMWRKNRRNNGGGVYGVDLNRNYGYNWGWDDLGSSANASSGNYRGPAPFSEPETSAIRWFHAPRQIATAFHYHAWGSYEIHPFAYEAGAFPPSPDWAEYLRYANALKAINGYKVGNFSQTLGYLANGEAIDWSYGEQTEKNKVMAFLPEVGTSSDGMWPPASRIFPLCELNLAPNLYWAWIAGSRGELVQASAGPVAPIGANSSVLVQVENRGWGASATDLSVTLACGAPYVSVLTPRKPFVALAPLQLGSNFGDPLEFFVSANAPNNYPITLTVGLLQGDVLRGTTTIQVVTPPSGD